MGHGNYLSMGQKEDIVSQPQSVPSLQYRFFSGPNIHAPNSIIRLNLHLGNFIDLNAAQIDPNFFAKLIEYFPTLANDRDLITCQSDGGNIIGQTLLSTIVAVLDLLSISEPGKNIQTDFNVLYHVCLTVNKQFLWD